MEAMPNVPQWLRNNFPEKFPEEPTLEESRGFLKARAGELKHLKEKKCVEATSDVVSELSATENALSRLELVMRMKNKAGFRRIERLVGLMATMNQRLFVEHGVDLCFGVRHHVTWLEWNEGRGKNVPGAWVWYAEKDDHGGISPCVEGVQEMYQAMRAIYVKHTQH